MARRPGGLDSGLDKELASTRQFTDPDGLAPGGLDGTYPGGIGRGGSDYENSWDDAPSLAEAEAADDGPAEPGTNGGYPVEMLDDDGSIETVLVVGKHSDANGTVMFTTSTGLELVQPRFAGGLLVTRETVETRRNPKGRDRAVCTPREAA